MSGYSITLTADVRTRPDVTDVSRHIARGLEVLRTHPDVENATHRHDAHMHRVTFQMKLRQRLTPDLAARRAVAALHDALESVGISTSRHGAAGALPLVQVRLPHWPDSIRRT